MRRVLNVRMHASVWVGICLLMLCWRAVLVLWLHASQGRVFPASDTRMDSILFGCILAMVANPLLGHRPSRGLVSFFLGAWTCIAVAYCIVGPRGQQVFGFTLQSMTFVPIFAVVMQHQQTRWVSWLASSPMVLVGKLSYTLYLCHFTILLALKHYNGGRLSFPVVVLALAMSVAISWLVYVFVDKPLAGVRRRLHKARRNRLAASSGEMATASAERFQE